MGKPCPRLAAIVKFIVDGFVMVIEEGGAAHWFVEIYIVGRDPFSLSCDYFSGEIPPAGL